MNFLFIYTLIRPTGTFSRKREKEMELAGRVIYAYKQLNQDFSPQRKNRISLSRLRERVDLSRFCERSE